ncbi:MAG TPA: MarR family transcriptional regulator [Candidatus Krumholzibacterium sp.]|nr:MarR family transcriptional regulator [Candidatus Krumholzibacterium sp.]
MTKRKDETILRIADLVFQLRQKCSIKDQFLVSRMGISLGDYNCLMLFFDSSSMGMKEMSERLGITPGGVTRVVAGLEKQGLVERRISLQDRRNIDVVLTGQGEQAIDEIKQASIEMHTKIIDKLEPSVRGKVVESIESLVAAIGEWFEENGKRAE